MCTDSTKYLILHLLPHVQMVHTIQGNEGAEICVEIGAEPAHVGRPSPGVKRMILISVFVYPLHSPGVRLDLGGDVIGHLR